MQQQWVRSAVSLGLIGLAVSVAQAQDVGADGEATAAAGEMTERVALEEVIVSARRRDEFLQETPVAVTAFSGDQLADAGITNILELEKVVPSLSMSEDGSKVPKFFIRGIGARSGGTVLDPGVGIYLNEILIPRPIGQLLETVDIASVQALRGPQGTLFGKNNTGGAILFQTVKPDMTEAGGSLFTRVGEHGRRDTQIVANVPLIEERMAARLSLSITKEDGFLENVVDGVNFSDEDRIGAALSLAWEVTDNLSADVFGFWSRTDEKSQGPTCVFQNPDASLPNLVFPQQPNYEDSCRESGALGPERKIAFNSESSVFEVESSMLALTLNWVISDELELKSITGYSRWDNILVNDDQDGSRAIIVSGGGKGVFETLGASGFEFEDDDRWQVTQEFKISGAAFDDRLQYTTGVFFSTEEMQSVPDGQLVGPGGLGGVPFSFASNFLLPVPGFSDAIGGVLDENSVIPFTEWLGEVSYLKNESLALFGEVSIDLLDWLELTIGGRYTTETRERTMFITEVDTDEMGQRLGAAYIEEVGFYTPIPKSQFDAQFDDPRPIPLRNLSSFGGEQDFKEFTPSATLNMLAPAEWLETMRLDSFLVYATASKGFKAGGLDGKGQELIVVDPEFVTNYELGFKLDAVDSRFRFNASVFSTEWEDMQVNTNELGDSITGTEILSFYTNASRSTIQGAEIETSFTFSNWFVNANVSYLDTAFDEFMGNSVTPFVGEETVDRSGEPFFITPDLSGAVAVSYNWLTPIGMITPRLAITYRSELFTGLDFTAVEYESSYIEELTLFDFRLMYNPSERLQLTFVVDNVTDEYYYTSGFTNSGALGAAMMIQGKPRTLGLELDWEF